MKTETFKDYYGDTMQVDVILEHSRGLVTITMCHEDIFLSASQTTKLRDILTRALNLHTGEGNSE